VSTYIIPLEVVAGVFFILVSLVFIGVGQAMGRAFSAIANPLAAYTVNLAGSLAGIIVFATLSYLRTGPALWFALGTGLVLYFIKEPFQRLASAAAAALLVLGLLVVADPADLKNDAGALTTWSPYYKVRYIPGLRGIDVNNIQHQVMWDITRSYPQYQVPYLLNRGAGGPALDDVLIIGAGTGNDVATALAHGAKHVDAVEIDPVIYEFGQRYHPNHHSADPRVSWHIDDGRSFVRSTSKMYDLIIYALVDSLVLHSGYSSIRLESFLFTEQAFRDLKAHLNPGGLLAIYNQFRRGWMIGRLAKLEEQVFGTEPIVLSLPHRPTIAAADNQANALTFVLAGGPESTALRSIRAKLELDRFFWHHADPRTNDRVNAYGPAVPAVAGTLPGEWYKLGPAEVQTDGIGPLPTDDYPFLYLRDAAIPGLNLRGMVIVAALALAILYGFAPVRTVRPNGQMFFLGAGFMLLETKGVVHLALLFGSTWMVNSIVFAAILVMALLSNLYVLKMRPRALWPYYGLLMASLLVNIAIPMTAFLALPGLIKVVASCLVVFVPVFFAGVVFAVSFAASRRPDVDFGSNIGGIILGGLSENLSLVLGFNRLLIVAIVFYVCSALLAQRNRATTSSQGVAGVALG
jgi:hypothetical protein